MTPGTVYRQFSCGHLLTDRPARLHKRSEETGKFTTFTVCPVCKSAESTFEYQIRVCIDCGKIDTAVRALRGDRCQPCSKRWRQKNRRYSGVDPNPTRYYQAGKRIEKPKKLVTEHWCRHRLECLPDDNRAFLHCGGCEKFERERCFAPPRDHDPFEWAYGEAV